MNKRIKLANAFGTGLMVACYLLAFVAASVAALTVIGEGGLTDRGLSIAGVMLGATGVWIALGFFVYAEKSRQEFEGCLEERLDDMVEQMEEVRVQMPSGCKLRLTPHGHTNIPSNRSRAVWQ